jgi:hypothetical protein
MVMQAGKMHGNVQAHTEFKMTLGGLKGMTSWTIERTASRIMTPHQAAQDYNAVQHTTPHRTALCLTIPHYTTTPQV